MSRPAGPRLVSRQNQTSGWPCRLLARKTSRHLLRRKIASLYREAPWALAGHPVQTKHACLACHRESPDRVLLICAWPPRITLDFIVTCERNFSTVLLALYSWTQPRMVLPSTIASTIMASTHSPTTPETIAAKMRIRTSGLLNWLSNKRNAVASRWARIVFSPYCFRRFSASEG